MAASTTKRRNSESTRWSCSTPCEKRSARRPPDARRFVGAGGGDALAVGEERHGHNAAAVSFVGAQLFAGLGIPETQHPVKTGRDDAPAVRREDGGAISGRFTWRC